MVMKSTTRNVIDYKELASKLTVSAESMLELARKIEFGAEPWENCAIDYDSGKLSAEEREICRFAFNDEVKVLTTQIRLATLLGDPDSIKSDAIMDRLLAIANIGK
jgi:hypothetical protein